MIDQRGAVTKHSPDSTPERELPLNEKVALLIQNVADMAFASSMRAGGSPSPDVPAETVSAALKAWRHRSDYLPGELVSDPAWGMLLELLHAEIEERRMTVPDLCTASTAAPGTAERWLKAMEERSLVTRRTSPREGAAPFVELTPKAGTALRHYFRDVVQGR
jgi:DNA-binding MarR family transcriptional regulator